MKWNRIAGVACLVLACGAALAGNVDLSTLPSRDTVQLTIYNSEDLTLVRETRSITFKRGSNLLQFSWANTLIDPTSVDLRFRSSSGQLDLRDTTFPHDKPQMLYWNVDSEIEGDAVVEISYFTSGITWNADYRSVADRQEQQMSFDGFVRISNNSGEDYADAEIRLVVGTINLVEKVTELARRGLIAEADLDGYRQKKRKIQAFPQAARSEMLDEAAKGFAMAEMAPKDIVKQGLSEYFIFSIPGTETVANGWSKRMPLFDGRAVPFDVRYRFRPEEYGDQLVRLFVLRNDEASKLGSTPLPDGMLRLYRQNGGDGLSFVAQQSIRYVPIGQKIELNLGVDPEVVHERIRVRSFRDEFWYRRGGVNVFYNPKQGHRIQIDDTVVGWDDHQQWIERIRNYRDKPISLEFRHHFEGHVIFESHLDPLLHDYRSPQFVTTVDPGGKEELEYELIFRQGHNRKQDSVTLRDAS